MSSLSKHDARLLALKTLKREVCNLTEDDGEEEDEIYYLSEKAPFFDVILAKSHVNPANTLSLPVAATKMLPRTMVPVILRRGGKSWMMYYSGDCGGRPRFDSKWKNFVIDNHLRHGDACVFELIDPNCTKPVFKVHILRRDMPPELLALVDNRGKTSDSPIVID